MNLDFSIIWNNLDYFWKGFLYTVELTFIAISGGACLGLLLALARFSRVYLVRTVAGLYVNLMRSVPLLLALFWIFFLAPLMLQWFLHSPRPVKIGPEKTAIFTFILFEAAYYCEIIRSGINSVSSGQWSASLALGLSRFQMMFYVILPQAIKNMIPVLLTQAIVLFQDTSLVYVISATDLMGAASKIGMIDGSLIEPYLFVAVIYLAISIVLSTAVYRLRKA
ncbi:MAG: amino acid ABC transporter permease [Candidimonas sp.]|nr:MAG: amino acid ABC transporter permease [Candidimonas sp.]TAM25137.1 MAG: amino acid ABC transporter permease [Candidimonas sp.]